MKTFISLSVFLILFWCVSSARATDQYRFDTWTTDNGLPQNGVRSIVQTPDGYLWFTTFDGLVRFDGLRFTTFNKSNSPGILNNRFSYLYSDLDGTLYATSTEDGVLTIYRNGAFKSMTADEVPGHYIQEIKPDANGELQFLSEDDSRKSKTWYYLRNGTFVFARVNEHYNERIELEARDGSHWTITPGLTLQTRGESTFEYKLDLSAVDFGVNHYIDREGALWIGERRLHRLKNGTIETFGDKDGLSANSINHSFWETDDGSLWFATGGGMSGGVGLGRRQNGKFSFFDTKDGLADNSIFDLLHDREGNIWVSTNKGLSRLRKRVISGLSKDAGLEYNEVYPLLRDRSGNTWVGTNKGLSLYREGRFETVRFKPANPSSPEQWNDGATSVQSLFEDANGKLWIGLNGGIYVAKNGAGELLSGTKGTHVFAIKSDRSGNVWAATNKGLWRYRDYVREASYALPEGLPNEFVTEIFEDSKGRLWFGTLGGLSEYRDGKFINYTVREGLAGNYVRTVFEDSEGTMWIGTYDEGMSRFKDGKFVNFKESNGLFNNGVFAIREDKRGNFWISSNKGIYRVSRNELNAFADGLIKRINSTGYGKDDGMLVTECNGGRQPASLVDDAGRFWFPTQDGIAIVDPEAEAANPASPTVIIEGTTVEREPTQFRGGLSIEPGQRNIEITYTGISLIKSEQIKFKYKLEGHDPDWVEAGTRRSAHYSTLPPGVYRFRVIAANSEGVWNEEGATLEVTLKPFFYQTLWFYLLCAVIIVVLLGLVWQLSVHELRRRERRLSRLVTEQTDELRLVNAELEYLANSDGLTKIGNRRRFEKFLADEWSRAVRFKTEMSLVLLDIDHFKLYNDTYGHQTGDECLQRVAEALADAINRPTDLVARFGGEEFAIILGGTDAVGALNIARQAINNVNQLLIPHLSSTTSEYLTISAGIGTLFPRFCLDEADLIRAADTALYQAKKSGRNRIICNDLTMLPDAPGILDEELLEIR
ncbi:MAG: diguanylate cyclase [Acidobacteria bacterium]|nr:diguanylate cyclase [Acidobacteriota bacterium]